MKRKTCAYNRLKEIKKRKTLRGKQRVVLLMNSVSKRTVVLLNPSLFYFFIPFFKKNRGRPFKTTSVDILVLINYCGFLTAFFCRVTAVCASNLPFIEAPVCILIPVFPKIIPSK